MGYHFVLFIASSHKGAKEHICAEALVGAEILLVPPVFLVNSKSPLPFPSITITYIFPVTERRFKNELNNLVLNKASA